ncbi:MAG: hypothetical protein HN919_20080 [Verrucomicrobia bacterium]|jgi:hypothetical protein|nr:hypothetical protein [Verrucomicrobiota bacterium]MBT7068605.1 hypothetical protein [Verrucomicrobiota bacterium]MBT7698731.1 hypothetical protein [Verrucomicrobiota bacterium]
MKESFIDSIRRMTGVAFGLLLVGSLCAQDDYDTYGPQPTGAPQAKKQYEANLKAHKGNRDRLVLPGLVADRKERTVDVLAECTGLNEGDLAEFLLVDQGSSHGYEALLWSFAKPSDVHRALEFIGLKPGAPHNPALPRLWSDGDRVCLMVQSKDGDAFPIEQMILDNETETTLPEEGFVFAGSIMVPPQAGQSQPHYAADVYDPRSVASVYNEPAAVLDVPRAVGKGEAYGNQVVNPEYSAQAGELVTIVMTPADPDGQPPVRELLLSIDSITASNKVACRLLEAKGDVLHAESSMSAMLEQLVVLSKEGATISVDLAFADTLPVRHVGKICTLMAMMETMGMVRVKPPADGALYYRAFVPDKRWSRPEGRPTQPWELHLTRKAGKLTGELVLHEAVWADGSMDPTFTRKACAVAVPGDLRTAMDRDAKERQAAGRRPLPAVLLVFADPGLTYGEVVSFVTPTLSMHSTVYVFVE